MQYYNKNKSRILCSFVCTQTKKTNHDNAYFREASENKIEYLSKIRALKGREAVSFGGGTFATIASKISDIPIPSYIGKCKGENKKSNITLLLIIDNK